MIAEMKGCYFLNDGDVVVVSKIGNANVVNNSRYLRKAAF